mgnify:CR=1 FL=1
MESELLSNFSFRVKQREFREVLIYLQHTLPPLPPYPGHMHSFFFSASDMLLVEVSSLLLLCLSAAAGQFFLFDFMFEL